MGGDFITNRSRISVRMILSALRSSTFSITTFTNLAQSLRTSIKRDAIGIHRRGYVFLRFALARSRNKIFRRATTGVYSSKKTGGTSTRGANASV